MISDFYRRIAQIPEIIEHIKSSIVTETTCNFSEKMLDVKVAASAYDATINMNLQEIIESQKVLFSLINLSRNK